MAYTTINKSTDYFNTKLYTGNGSNGHSISGVGFQPDLVWIKARSAGSTEHHLMDVLQGWGTGSSDTPNISSNNTSAAYNRNIFSSNNVNADGFELNDYSDTNTNSQTHVAWNWKAGTTSGITTDSETDITPTAYSFNATSGFSIVKYTGTGTAGEGIPHGLGAKPQFIIVKRTDTTGAWTVFTQPILNTSNATKFLEMHNTDAEATNTNRWNGWQPDTVNFYVGTADEVNASGGTYIAYVFAEIDGYSKFGSYVSNGVSGNGSFTYLGFKPSFVIHKRIDSTGDWRSWNNKADAFNQNNKSIFPNTTASEYDTTAVGVDFLSNGIKWRQTDTTNNNPSGGTFIYMAFGQSLVGSNNVPCTAR